MPSQIISNGFIQSFNLFNRRQRLKLISLGVVQVLLGFIDIVAVGILAVLGNLAVVGVQSRLTSGNTYKLLEFLGIANSSIQHQATILGGMALGMMLLRSLASILIIRVSLRGISAASARISADLVAKVFNSTKRRNLGRSPQEVLYSLTQGVTLVTIGIVGTFVSIVGDIGLVLLMFLGIIAIDPIIALLSLIFFGITLIILSRNLHGRAIALGSETADLNIRSNKLILEAVSLQPELLARNRVNYFTNEISELRSKLMETNRELVFLPNISKYVFETTVLVGAFLIAGIEFLLFDAPTAVASLTLFLAAGSRVIPALLRAQQGLMSIKTSIAASESTLQLVVRFAEAPNPSNFEMPLDLQHQDFNPQVEVKDGRFKFEDENDFELKGINFMIPSGQFTAIVGKSGAGKSTLINLILGTKSLDSGEILVSGLPPLEAARKWSGAIAYVPQNIQLIDASIRENVLLGYSTKEIVDEKISTLLESLGLQEVLNRPDGLDTKISEFLGGLSGGQIQRIGIARALVTNPKLIILDEATSSLDAETESYVSSLLESLRGKVTIVVVAHRLSTVQRADKLYWMADGSLVNSGTFDELRHANKDFETSVNLLGL
jgi:ABC-type multidrug transport system fused ATPase/permease subunit